jgi:hypothetical protein
VLYGLLAAALFLAVLVGALPARALLAWLAMILVPTVVGGVVLVLQQRRSND